MPHFGFLPSEKLLHKVQSATRQNHSAEPLYLIRNDIAVLVNEEIIDAILTHGIQNFPMNEKRDTVEKLVVFVKSSVATLLKQLLTQAPNKDVQASLKFSQNTLFKDPQGIWRMGLQLEKNLVTNLKQTFAEILQGQKIDLKILSEHYKFFADEIICHYIHDFNQTLQLGMLKRKAADMSCTVITKAVHIAIDRISPKLTKDELKALAHYHDALFFYE